MAVDVEIQKMRQDRSKLYAKRAETVKRAADIGEIPPVANPQRRAACEKDLELYLKTYFPHSTGLSEFSDDHKSMIGAMQRVIMGGGRRINAIYRGAAKTTIGENATLWAISYGYRKYVVDIGASQGAADEMILSIKTEIETNELLEEDFPEICKPILALEGSTTRCPTQTQNGLRTRIKWGADLLIFPTIVYEDGSYAKSSGAVVKSVGIDCSIRGMKQKLADGTSQRPDQVICDDIQTDQSAANPQTVRKIISIIKKSVMKLAGHRESIAAIINSTVIEEDDVIDTLLDHQRHPEWQGVRIPLVKSWSTNHDEMWLGTYATIRNTYDNELLGDIDRAHSEATEYYKANREAMDDGCVTSWRSLYDPENELSAIQHAYNHLIDDGEEVFSSEYQNNPKKADTTGEIMTRAKDFAVKKHDQIRYAVPINANKISLSIDVQQNVLFYSVLSFSSQFDIYAIDYGTWPEQKKDYFEYKDIRATISKKYPDDPLEEQIRKALIALLRDKLKKIYKREDGLEMNIDIALCDGGYMGEVVKSVCLMPEFRRRVYPIFGRGIKASEAHMLSAKPKKGEMRSSDQAIPWRLLPGDTGGQHVLFDANAVKTYVHRRISTAKGKPGTFTLFKTRKRHDMYADNFCASETPGEPVSTRGRTVSEWKHLPSRPDNHFFDTGTMGTVAGSMLGSRLNTVTRSTKKPKKKKRRKQKLL